MTGADGAAAVAERVAEAWSRIHAAAPDPSRASGWSR